MVVCAGPITQQGADQSQHVASLADETLLLVITFEGVTATGIEH